MTESFTFFFFKVVPQLTQVHSLLQNLKNDIYTTHQQRLPPETLSWLFWILHIIHFLLNECQGNTIQSKLQLLTVVILYNSGSQSFSFKGTPFLSLHKLMTIILCVILFS